MSYVVDAFREYCAKANVEIDFKIPSLDITPVAEYVVFDPDCKFNEFITIKDFPCVRPPFDKLWAEYRWKRDGHNMGMGFIVLCEKKKDCDRGSIYIKFVAMIDSEISLEKYMAAVDFNEQGEPIMELDLTTGKKSFIRIILADVAQSEDPDAIQQGRQWADVFAPTLSSLLLSFSFLSCKNVQTAIIRDSSDALNRKRVRSGKLPLTRMYTLKVDGVKQLFKSKTATDKFSENAYHICRGHFKDFSHGGGLFGKYAGRYWWQSQARGSKDKGEIIKKYEIAPVRKK